MSVCGYCLGYLVVMATVRDVFKLFPVAKAIREQNRHVLFFLYFFLFYFLSLYSQLSLILHLSLSLSLPSLSLSFQNSSPSHALIKSLSVCPSVTIMVIVMKHLVVFVSMYAPPSFSRPKQHFLFLTPSIRFYSEAGET